IQRMLGAISAAGDVDDVIREIDAIRLRSIIEAPGGIGAAGSGAVQHNGIVIIIHIVGAAVVDTVSVAAAGNIVDEVIAYNVLQRGQRVYAGKIYPVEGGGAGRVAAERIGDPVTADAVLGIQAGEVNAVEG